MNISSIFLLPFCSTSQISSSDRDHPDHKVRASSCRKTPGKRWNMEAVFPPEVFGFFLVHSDHFLGNSDHVLANSDRFLVNYDICFWIFAETGRKSPNFSWSILAISWRMLTIFWWRMTIFWWIFRGKRLESYRKKSDNFRSEYCFHLPIFFPCFPAGSDGFPASFRRDPPVSSSRNHRPGSM